MQACRSSGQPVSQTLVAGALDAGNRSALSQSGLAELQDEPRIRCLGHVDQMEKSHLVTLFCCRPGVRLSRALIEAAAMGARSSPPIAGLP